MDTRSSTLRRREAQTDVDLLSSSATQRRARTHLSLGEDAPVRALSRSLVAYSAVRSWVDRITNMCGLIVPFGVPTLAFRRSEG